MGEARASNPAELERLIADLQRDLYRRLGVQRDRRPWTRLLWLPQENKRIELVRLWQRTIDDLGEIRYLVGRRGFEGDAAVMLKALFMEAREQPPFASLDAARQFSVELREVIPLLGDAAY